MFLSLWRCFSIKIHFSFFKPQHLQLHLTTVIPQPCFLCRSVHRAPEPQKPHSKPLEDMVRSNHYDPDEDEEYYRKQLSYFDRRSFDSKAMGQPSPGMNRFHDLPKPSQLSYPYSR